MTKKIELTGQIFGRLTVLKANGSNKHGRALWICCCECGNKTSVLGGTLISGHTSSCGCLRRDATIAKLTIHGCAKKGNIPSEYTIWVGMRQRCSNPNHKSYHNYGGRGITVCDRWLNSFTNFLKDIGKKPSPSHTIDRVNNDGNYDPSNCKWATRKEQANNTRRNK